MPPMFVNGLYLKSILKSWLVIVIAYYSIMLNIFNLVVL